nr:MAG TPA: hypothetical protein [Caudoviricetes sp.]
MQDTKPFFRTLACFWAGQRLFLRCSPWYLFVRFFTLLNLAVWSRIQQYGLELTDAC